MNPSGSLVEPEGQNVRKDCIFVVGKGTGKVTEIWMQRQASLSIFGHPHNGLGWGLIMQCSLVLNPWCSSCHGFRSFRVIAVMQHPPLYLDF